MILALSHTVSLSHTMSSSHCLILSHTMSHNAHITLPHCLCHRTQVLIVDVVFRKRRYSSRHQLRRLALNQSGCQSQADASHKQTACFTRPSDCSAICLSDAPSPCAASAGCGSCSRTVSCGEPAASEKPYCINNSLQSTDSRLREHSGIRLSQTV